MSNSKFVKGSYVEPIVGDDHVEETHISTFTTVAIPIFSETQSFESRLFQSLIENNSQVLTE